MRITTVFEFFKRLVFKAIFVALNLFIIIVFPSTVYAMEYTYDECIEIQTLVERSTIDEAEKALRDSRTKMCAAVFGHYFYKKGDLKKAGEEFEYARKYADSRLNIDLYRDIFYFNLALNSKRMTETRIMEDYHELKMLENSLAEKLRPVLKQKFLETASKFLADPLNWNFKFKELRWTSELRLEDEIPGFENVYSSFLSIFELKKHPKKSSIVQEIITILQKVEGTILHVADKKYTITSGKQLNSLGQYKKYMEHVEKAKEISENREKAIKFKTSIKHYSLAKSYNVRQDPYIDDFARSEYQYRKYMLMSDIEFALNVKNEKLVDYRISEKWLFEIKKLEKSTTPIPIQFKIPVNLLNRYYELLDIASYDRFHCRDPYLEFIMRNEWSENFVGKDLLTITIRDPVLGKIKKNTLDMIQDIDNFLRNKKQKTYHFVKLDQAGEMIDCIDPAWRNIVGKQRIDILRGNIFHLESYYNNKAKGNSKAANVALSSITDDIVSARGIKRIIDCENETQEIRKILSESDGIPEIEKLQNAAMHFNSDRIIKNDCSRNYQSNYYKLLIRLKDRYFTLSMEKAFSYLDSVNIDEGIKILEIFLKGKYYFYNENEYKYIYASAKLQLFKGIKEKRSTQHVSKYFDKNILKAPGLLNVSGFFKDEEKIVPKIIKNYHQTTSKKSEKAEIGEGMKPEKSSFVSEENEEPSQKTNNYIEEKLTTEMSKDVDVQFNNALSELKNSNFRKSASIFHDYLEKGTISEDKKLRADVLGRLAFYIASGGRLEDKEENNLKNIIDDIAKEDRDHLLNLLNILESKENPFRNKEQWFSIREKGEMLLSDFKYEKAFAYFSKYRIFAMVDGYVALEKRQAFSNILLKYKKIAREQAARCKTTDTFKKMLNQAFTDGGELDAKRYYHSSDSFFDEKSIPEPLNAVHKKHLNYIFWSAFGDRRKKENRKKDAFENYTISKKFAQTPREKEMMDKKIVRLNSTVSAPAREPEQKFFVVFQHIGTLTDRAVDQKASKSDIDEIIKKIRDAGKSGLSKNDLDHFANRTAAKLYIVGKALKRYDKALAAILFVKFLNSEFLEKCDPGLPNIIKVKMFIENEL